MDLIKNLCAGTKKIEVTSGMHIGTSYRCPGCIGCMPKKIKKISSLKENENTDMSTNSKFEFGAWRDGLFP